MIITVFSPKVLRSQREIAKHTKTRLTSICRKQTTYAIYLKLSRYIRNMWYHKSKKIDSQINVVRLILKVANFLLEHFV